MISKLAESGSGCAGQNRTITRRARDASKIHIEFPNVRKVTTENDHYHKNRSRATPVNVGSAKSPKRETAKPLSQNPYPAQIISTPPKMPEHVRSGWSGSTVRLQKSKKPLKSSGIAFPPKGLFFRFQFFGSDFFQKSLIAYFIRKNKPAKKTGSNSEYAL